MNLIFRLLYVALASFRRPRLGPRDESVLHFRVLPTDLDLNFHMNNGRFLTIMDLGRVDLLIRLGVVGAMRRLRWRGVVASVTTRFQRPLSPFQRYELRTRLLCWDDRWFFMEHRFTRRGELMAHGLVKIQFSSREGRLQPQQVIDATPHPAPSPPVPPAVVEWQEAERALVAGDRPAPALA
ncbi:MAG TPA: acyl-CoA thioesterase [Longimicrobiaceae bacterium]|nr:acyl-CoA thioesterase [Longimicrobiaceae bacterium]